MPFPDHGGRHCFCKILNDSNELLHFLFAKYANNNVFLGKCPLFGG